MKTVQRSTQHGLMRPLRKLGLSLAKHWPWPVEVRIVNGRRMYVDVRSGIGRGIFAKSAFDLEVFTPLCAALQSGGTFLDIGANVGFYSMLALDAVGTSGAVHAFEIDERPLRCLRKTISRHQIGNLFLHEIAVGRHDGLTGILIGKESGHSAVAEHTGGRQIKMVTLDRWWRTSNVKNIQAIKMDIEGAELPALEGAKEILREVRPVVVCEADEALQKRFAYDRADLLRLFAEERYRVTPLNGAWSPTLVARPE